MRNQVLLTNAVNCDPQVGPPPSKAGAPRDILRCGRSCLGSLSDILPSWNYCRASWIIFCQCKEVQQIYIHEVVLVMKVHLNVQDPILNIR